MASRPLVSVVTPVYNGERFLCECIESVLAQTYDNWEYVLVNNCSTDRTLAIAEEYAARDRRIQVHTNAEFVRAIPNHNIALRRIAPESRYCKPLGADDWLFPDCLAQMVALAEEHPSVAIVGAYALYGLPEAPIAWTGLPYPSTVVAGADACRLRLLGGPYVFGTPTAVLYRSDIVRGRDPFYNESNFHADSEVCFDVLEQKDFGFVHQVLTYRRMQDGSLTTRSQDLNTYLPGVLLELVRYGPKYLTPVELEGRIRAHLRDYYRYLGKQVYRRRGRELWRYHRDKLADLGFPLRRTRVTAAALGFALDAVLNPKATAEAALRRLRALVA